MILSIEGFPREESERQGQWSVVRHEGVEESHTQRYSDAVVGLVVSFCNTVIIANYY